MLTYSRRLTLINRKNFTGYKASSPFRHCGLDPQSPTPSVIAGIDKQNFLVIKGKHDPLNQKKAGCYIGDGESSSRTVLV